MRTLLLLFTFACFLLPATFVNARPIHKGPYLASVSDTHPGEPKFMDGIYMDGHHRKVIFRNVMDIKRPEEKSTLETVAGIKSTNTIDSIEEKEPVAISKNDLADKDTVQEIAHTSETIDNNPAPPISITKPTDIKQAAPITDNTNTHSADVVVVDMPEEEVDPVIGKYAGMIEVEPSDINNYPLYRFIDKWYGTGYKWGGSDSTGIDCSAFSQKLYGSVYRVGLLRTARQQHRKSERIKHYEDATEGDLVFFHVHSWRVSHVGVYLANGYFVHASRSRGVVISSLANKYWHKRYSGCGRIERKEEPAESDGGQ